MEKKIEFTVTDANRLMEALPCLGRADFERIVSLYNRGLLCAPQSVASSLVKAIQTEQGRRTRAVRNPGDSGWKKLEPLTPEREVELLLSLRPGQVYQTYSLGKGQTDFKRLSGTKFQMWDDKGTMIILSSSLPVIFGIKKRKNPLGVGPVEAACDYGHLSREVRALPLGGGGNALLCKYHYEQERKARSEEGVPTPEWRQLRLYRPNPCQSGSRGRIRTAKGIIPGSRNLVSGNPLTKDEKDKLWKMAAEHMKDSIEHKDPELKALDKGTALGLKEAIATLENPAHPFVYLPRIVEPGTTRIVAPRSSLTKLVEYFQSWGANVDGMNFKNALRGLMTNREIEIPGGHPFRRFFVTRIPRKTGSGYPVTLGNSPVHKGFKPYYKRWDEYMGFLEDTLIPDLEESKSSYAEDFNRILAMLKGEEVIDREYILWLRTTLIPDSIESGYTSTAHSLQEGLYWLALSDAGRKAEIQRKNPLGESSCGDMLRHAKIIGTDCLAVEYMDIPKAKREGVRNPERPWRHDFKMKGIKVWGLKDGSVLLTGPKPLWRSQPNSITGK